MSQKGAIMKPKDEENNQMSQFDPYAGFELDVYLSLLKDRTILLNSDIDKSVIERIVLPIVSLGQKSKKPIKLLINSPGGSVTDGQAIVDSIVTSPCQIITIAMGAAMSASFDIFLAGDYRVCYPNTQLMMHSGSTMLGLRTLPAVNIEADLHKLLFKRWAAWYAGRTNIAEKEWLSMLSTGLDSYWFPEQALKDGLVHEIITPVAKSIKNLSKIKF
jgi:ATP-dependent Clp protease protease subunit